MNIKEFLKGIIIGIAKIIPGLSGAVLMISFNLYDKAIEAITTFFNNPKKNFIFLLNLSLGIIIGIVAFSNILRYFVTNYYVYTTSLFIGLILGGIPVLLNSINKEKKDYLIIIISFIIMSLISLSNIDNTYILKHNALDIIMFFIAGLLEAIGTILPGISSTALLMLIGIYNIFLSSISNLFNPIFISKTITFLIPFSLGLFIGIVILSLLVNYLFKYHKSFSFSLILGISLSSIFLLILKVLNSITSPLLIPLSIILLLLGYIITNKI